MLLARRHRTKPLRMDELKAYIGLELGTSVTRSNRLGDYWTSCDLLGNEFFSNAQWLETHISKFHMRFVCTHSMTNALHSGPAAAPLPSP